MSNAEGHQEPLELPRNVKLISLIMQAMDVNDYSPAVLPMLNEFLHRYVLDVVGDAQLFAEHAGRGDVEVDDVRLAVQGQLLHSFTSVPSKEVLSEIAASKNVAPLPLVAEKHGLRIPPERHALTGSHFQILPKKPSLAEPKKPSVAAPAPKAPSAQQQQFQQFQQQQQMQQNMAFQPQPFMFGGMGQPVPAFNPPSMNFNAPGGFMNMMQGGMPQANMMMMGGGAGQPMAMHVQPLQPVANTVPMKMEEDDYDDE
ncbi:hypothetical protein HDU98_008069 [Podochytrium sp. JEL0797]|nr:hypothetical protein HDU98_008069 [Podochytrium sp. JEL0797]